MWSFEALWWRGVVRFVVVLTLDPILIDVFEASTLSWLPALGWPESFRSLVCFPLFLGTDDTSALGLFCCFFCTHQFDLHALE